MNAEQTLNSKITNAVASAVASPATAAKPEDVRPISASVIAAVVPAILSATNNEPWWQSRVTWGAILSLVASILAIFGVAFPSELQGQVLTAIMAAVPLIGGLVTLYGRWAAKTPIGK